MMPLSTISLHGKLPKSARIAAFRTAVVAALVLLAGAETVRSQAITLRDMKDREVRLQGPAARIATIPIPMASTIITLDEKTDRLVGINSVAKSAILEGILGRIFPTAKDIRSDVVGQNFSPNVEALVATRPDVVVQWGDVGDLVVAPMTNAGLNVMLIVPGTEEQARQYMMLAATVLGKTARAEGLIAERKQIEAGILATTARITPERKPKALYLSTALSQLTVAGTGTIYDYFFTLTGAVNAAKGIDRFKPVNAEQIAEWNPDVIILNSFEAALALDRIYTDPILSLTSAAKTKRVYKMPLGGYRWDAASQESPMTWMWLANLMHPDRFNFNVRAEMTRMYKTLYGHTLAAGEIDEILRLSMQGSAANYAQFAAR